MNNWRDLIDIINYVGAKIDAAPLPVWIKWPLFVLLLFFVIFYIVRIIWSMAKKAEQNLEKEQDVEDYAMAYGILEERIKNESDPVKRALLEREKSEALGKLEPK